MPSADAFGARIAVLRMRRALTQEQVAQGLGWTQSEVSKLERGTRGLYPADLVRLAAILEVSIAELFEPEEAGTPLPVMTPALRKLLVAGAQLPPPFQRMMTQWAQQLHKGLTRHVLLCQVGQER